MIALLDHIYFTMRQKAVLFAERLREDETGVSAFVATILLILIVVILSAMFWENIKGWFETTWNSITGEADKIKR